MAQNKSGKNLLTPTRLVFTALVLTVVAMFGVSSCNSNDSTRTSTPTTKPATPSTNPRNTVTAGLSSLPPNVLDAQLPAASGSSIKLSDYSGKVLLVNLWATWCGPCRNETPELVKLNKEFQSRGVESEIWIYSIERPRNGLIGFPGTYVDKSSRQNSRKETEETQNRDAKREGETQNIASLHSVNSAS